MAREKGLPRCWGERGCPGNVHISMHMRVHMHTHTSSVHQTMYERPQTPISDSFGATFSEEPKETGIPWGRRGRCNPSNGRVMKNLSFLQQE